MKAKIILTTGLVALGFSLFAAMPAVINKKGGAKPINADDIKDVDAAGTITYVEGKFVGKVKKDEYTSVRLGKTPDEVTEAEKKLKDAKYEEALADFKKIYTSKFKYLGYELPSVYGQALCLSKLNKKDEAVDLLKKYDSYETADDKLQATYYNCKRLLASIYIEQSKFDEAYPVLTALGNSDDDSLSAFSFNARGEILKKQNKKKDAVLMYMRTALLFPKKISERGDSLVNIVNLLKEMNDNRYTKFEEILKKDYPEKAAEIK
jgi:tetratricopeptide (TPR) repeat protein